MEYDQEINRDAVEGLVGLANKAKTRSHNPYGEPAEGAIAVASNGSETVAVPGSLIENGNYSDMHTAAEAAISNAMVRGYDQLNGIVIARDEPQDAPLHHSTASVVEEFALDETPMIITDTAGTRAYTVGNRESETDPQLTDSYQVLGQPQKLGDGDNIDDLVAIARDQMENAYVPRSGYNVGSALLDADGYVHPGNNIENTEKRSVIHGEESAITHWATYSDAEPVALVAASRDGGNCCGSCKQWMAEFFADDVTIINASSDDTIKRTYGDIDPHPFRLDLDA